MAEMVLVMPLLLVILSLLFFLGWGMLRMQRTTLVDRYEVWREASDGTGPGADPATREDQLNDTFFMGEAGSIDLVTRTAFGDQDGRVELERAARRLSTDAGDLSREIVDPLVAGRGGVAQVQMPVVGNLWSRFDDTTAARHARLEHEWPYAHGLRLDPARSTTGWMQGWRYHAPHTHTRTALPDLFWQPFDRRLEGYENTGNDIARILRSFYRTHPRYRGPDVR